MSIVRPGRALLLAVFVIVVDSSACSSAGNTNGSSVDSGGSANPKPRLLDILVVADTANSSTFLNNQAGGVSALVEELVAPSVGPAVSDFRLAATFSFIRVAEIIQEGLCWFHNDESAVDGGDLVTPYEFPSRRYVSGSENLGADIYSQITKARVADCQLPAYLEAARRALDGRNADVIRDNSLLVVLFITSAEDCSTKDGSYWLMSTWPDNVRGHILCREPHHPDLIYSVEHYVTTLKGSHPNGSVLFAIIGSAEAPEFFEINGRRAVKPICDYQIQPTDRMKLFTDHINKLGEPRVQSIFVDAGCAAYKGDFGLYVDMADKIRSMMDLSGDPAH